MVAKLVPRVLQRLDEASVILHMPWVLLQIGFRMLLHRPLGCAATVFVVGGLQELRRILKNL